MPSRAFRRIPLLLVAVVAAVGFVASGAGAVYVFTRGAQHYDLILDTVGSHGLLDYRRVLTPRGALVIVGGPNKGNWIGPLTGFIEASLLSPFVSQGLKSMLAELTKEDLAVLAQLMQDGKVTPVIDRRYPLAETAAAVRYLEAGHARGKVIINVD